MIERTDRGKAAIATASRPGMPSRLSRRTFLAGAASVAAAAAGPFVWIPRAGAAGKVVIRTIGGSYEEANVKAIFEPFTKATGVEVVKVPATLGKLLAMFESGNIELDVVDAGELGVLSLSQKGALEKINYKSWKLTNPEDFDPAIRHDDMIANIFYSTVLGYNAQTFPTGKQPRSWAEFWDLKKFPGPRMLADLASGTVDFEFALLADGVPRDKIYPIDVNRAFKALDRVRPGIRKFWDTGALSAQMLADKEVVLGSIWNGRLQAVADKGAPLAIEWNEACLQTQFWSILKGAKNLENAQRFIEFACQPEIQASHAKHIPYGPTNRQAFKSISADVAARLPSSPEHKAKAFLQNGKWWADNRPMVSERWSQWLLQKG
ncbi:MAG TPA: ABC transporter substrate-binding protein [Methylomirabilota bacterium]|jgi:putative spermidine/putrescine transport system substrate-binding protein|nr:ABC transporter substrate-binding protein [Methylomirabilota bacterium]